jgi:SAM-dependent methyltransferase
MDPAWSESFFDADYLRLWGPWFPEEKTAEQVAGIVRVLGLHPGMRVLDAPCGFGRLSRPLAGAGLSVLGVDRSQVLLDEAERRRGAVGPDRLRYLRHDLREPLAEGGFDAALNVFTSLGYGSEEDDVAILRTLGGAVRAGGAVLVETNHRDALVALLCRDARTWRRLPDGTLMAEEPRLDAVTGRVETTWYWAGPAGSGQKSASLRVYSATELVRLMERAGLRLRGAYESGAWRPFEASGPNLGGRIALVAERA